jgi:hypothetical protein
MYYVVYTGGFSSSCSPRSSFAAMFAKTPSLAGAGPLEVGLKAGNSVTRLSTPGGIGFGSHQSLSIVSIILSV